MRNVNVKYRILVLYIILLLLCVISVSINYTTLYDKVIIIHDKDEVIKKINMSIPIKIVIKNEKLGSYILKDEKSIKSVWNSINEITNDNLEQVNYNNKESEIKIIGTVYYLNGMKDDFEVSNVLKVNNNIYYGSYKKPIISSLRNNLLGYLYSPYNIAQFISSRNRVIVKMTNKPNKNVGNDYKKIIKDIISRSVKIESDREIIKLATKKEEALVHIKVYIDEENDNILKTKCYNVINIDVYKEFFVVQYMGDENGRHIYMRGNLSEICKKIIGEFNE